MMDVAVDERTFYLVNPTLGRLWSQQLIYSSHDSSS